MVISSCFKALHDRASWKFDKKVMLTKLTRLIMKDDSDRRDNLATEKKQKKQNKYNHNHNTNANKIN